MIEALKNVLVMIELELRRLRHDRTEIYFRAVQPILWIVIYGPVMSSVRAIPTGGVPYTDFITPGVMIQTTTFVSIFYGLMMVWERDSGILKKLLVTPASRYSTVIGRSMASGVRAIFQALIILPIALIIGERFMGIGQAIMMPLFFASNALYPLQLMPPLLREFSTVNPLSYVVDAVRGLLITGDLSNLLVDLIAAVVFDAVLFVVASISFRRIIE